MVTVSYGCYGGKNLTDSLAEGISSFKDNIIYMGRLSNIKRDHVYHIQNVTGLVGVTEISLVAISKEEAEKAKNKLEKILNIKLVKI